MGETETIAEIVAEVRQYAEEELGITPFEELDAAIEEIVAMNRRLMREEENRTHATQSDEATDDKTQTA